MTQPAPAQSPIASQNFHNLLRYPGEGRALWFTLTLLALIVLFLSAFDFGLAAVFVLIGLWVVNRLVRISHRRQIGNAVRVSKTQLPELAQELAAAAERLRVPPLQAFVYQDYRINAYSFGWSPPQAVVLTSQLVKVMDADELRFVSGHEMGHIALGHTKLGTLVGGILGAPRIPILSDLILPIFMWWSRCAEYSADRAGVIACGKLDKSISALLKLMVGPDLAGQLRMDEILAQSKELAGKPEAMLGELGVSHPFLVHRVRALVNFWEDPKTQPLKSGDVPQ